ncbi:hypothetical protein CLF_111569 [Clonorchis sinensis]|uniref:Uncharacterized protein n=1 Tax=Clonorchis sinensis TaxID=79923 RepID=G7YLR7_CLOSI|nr:hypothetical protein CLF_111569 [Clonorchis sinensis]
MNVTARNIVVSHRLSRDVTLIAACIDDTPNNWQRCINTCKGESYFPITQIQERRVVELPHLEPSTPKTELQDNHRVSACVRESIIQPTNKESELRANGSSDFIQEPPAKYVQISQIPRIILEKGRVTGKRGQILVIHVFTRGIRNECSNNGPVVTWPVVSLVCNAYLRHVRRKYDSIKQYIDLTNCAG